MGREAVMSENAGVTQRLSYEWEGDPGRKERCLGRALATNVWERVPMMSIFPGVTPIFIVFY